MKRTAARLIPLVVLAAVAAGCTKGPPPDLYLLGSAAPDGLPGFEQGVTIGVGPVVIPPHLDRNQIVTRVSPTRLGLSEQTQWAEPLKVGVTRVLLVSIGLRLDSNRIYRLPLRQRRDLDYRVAVDLLRLDSRLGEEIVLSARWTILSGDGKKVLITKVSRIQESAAGAGTEAMVEAQSRAVSRLGQEIGDLIRERF